MINAFCTQCEADMYEKVALAIDIYASVVEDISCGHDNLVLDRIDLCRRVLDDIFAEAICKSGCARSIVSKRPMRSVGMVVFVLDSDSMTHQQQVIAPSQ